MDTVVVGGGIVGGTAAYSFACKGRQVLLIDGENEGYATAAGAGIISPATSIRTPSDLEPLAFASAAFYEGLVARLQADGIVDCGYDNPGTLFIAANASEVERLPEVRDLILRRHAMGVHNIDTVEMLDKRQTQHSFPVLGEECQAIFVSGGGRVNGRRLREALREGLRTRGGRMICGQARLVATGKSGIWGVEVNGDLIGADSIVLATGAWQTAWSSVTGVELPVDPQRGQILHLDVAGYDTANWPSIVGFGTYYMLAFAPHRVVAGATRETGAGFDYRVTAGGEAELLREALALAPGLSDATLVETRIGFRPRSRDDRPIVGPFPGSTNTYIATGLGALGLTMGPYIGSLVADMASNDEISTDLREFAVSRFE